MTPEAILAVMLTMRQAWEDRRETREQRTELLRPLATVVANEARTAQEAAAMTAIAWHETGGFARWIVECRCHERPKMCDHGRARGPFQVHDWCKATDLRGETECAASAYRFALSRCKDPTRAFGHYATGNSCMAMPLRETTRIMVLRRLQGS